MSDIKVILFCSTRLALPAIQELSFFRQLSVVAIPEHCVELIEEVQFLLSGTKISIVKVNKVSLSEKTCQAMKHYNIGLGLIITFPYKIPKVIFNFPHKGFFNIHPGPLPEYRGADPVFMQIKNKEPYAAITVHRVNEGIDSGPIVVIERVRLAATDTYGMITTRLGMVAAQQVRTLLKLIALDVNIPSVPQDASKARYFKKQLARDIVIDWERMNADDIIALINACNPWNKGAVTKIHNKTIRLLYATKVGYSQSRHIGPGRILQIDESGIIISTFQNEAIHVSMIYTDEGFLPAFYLAQMGIAYSSQFENFFQERM